MKILPPQTRSRCGFTLIEILVVVAILGILAALLLPAISRVQENALVAKSTNSLRQIGAALRMYAGENNGFLPAADGAANPTGTYWMLELNPYVGKDKQTGLVDTSEFFIDPVYRNMLGKSPNVWRGGYSMNRRMQHAAGIRDGNHPS